MTDSSAATSPAKPGRLADFIRENVDPIVAEWVRFAQTRTPASHDMTNLALKDHIVELLEFIADDLETPQSDSEQVRKSRGLGDEGGEFTKSAAEIHASLRLSDGFSIDQMVSEYRALRASVIKLWSAASQVAHADGLEDITRFNEAIDQALSESVSEYTSQINQSRDLFLGVLGHDLRNPIMAAQIGARMILTRGLADAQGSLISEQIATAMARATSVLDDLLELTRSAFNSELRLVPTPMNLGELATQIVGEARILSEGTQIDFRVTGETEGIWDRPKMGQVLSNLIGNALEYSPSGSPVTVTIFGQEDGVLISVHNGGEPIPLDQQKVIFNSLTRGRDELSERADSAHLGLGLFVARKITVAHGGTISVESSEEHGTTFSVLMPRSLAGKGFAGS